MSVGVLAALFALVSLSACESLKRVIGGEGLASIKRIRNPAVSGDPCGHADWFEVGRVDGLSGITMDHSTYIGRCESKGSVVDRPIYSAGWQRGLLEYCTPERGFDAGRSGQDYQGICPPHVEEAFLKRFKIGAEIAKLERKNAEIERQVDAKLRELESNRSQTPAPATSVLTDALKSDALKSDELIGSTKSSVYKELQSLRDLRARNDLEIRDLESASN
jgi:hypothetical protein